MGLLESAGERGGGRSGVGGGRLPAPPSLLPAYVTFGLVNTRTAHAHTIHMTGDTAADTDSRQLTIHFLLPCVQLSLSKTESHTFISCARLVIVWSLDHNWLIHPAMTLT